MEEVTDNFLQIHTFFEAVHGKIGDRGDNYPVWSVFQTLLIEVFEMSIERTVHPDLDHCICNGSKNGNTPPPPHGDPHI